MRAAAACLAVALCCAAGAGSAQTPPVTVSAGTSLRFYSDVLREERPVLISLPRTHAQGTQRYPVLILLDGDTHFQHAAAAAEFLSAEDRVPELIVVGLPNNARLRDLSPPTDVPEDVADGTGGDEFLRFIVDELLPWLEARHRAAPLRILFGHSRGGLINMQALLTRPGAFRAHIAASPYFGWSKGRMVARAAAEIATVPGPNFLYMTSGDGEPEIVKSIEEMTRVLKSKAPRTLTWKHEPLPGESHGSTPYLTLYNGLRAFFAEWSPIARRDAGDIAGVDAHYAALSRDFGYEIQPSAHLLYFTGHALLEQGKVDQAVGVFERNARMHPWNRYAFEGLGQALAKAGKPAEARRAMDTAYELARSTADAEEREFLRKDRDGLEAGRTP
jgi:predicted alpha/beta superfamily hydrolase